MKKVALVFPGQGSQYVGMGKDLYDRSPAAKQVFQEANEALGYDLASLCFQGPEEDLKLTANTQPAILTVAVAALRMMQTDREITPLAAAGHSLGEYGALVAAGGLRFPRCRAAGPPAGQVHAGSGPGGRGRHGRDHGVEPGRGGSPLPGGGAGGSPFPGKFQQPRADRHLRPRHGREAGGGDRFQTGGKESRAPAGERAFPLPPDEACGRKAPGGARAGGNGRP